MEVRRQGLQPKFQHDPVNQKRRRMLNVHTSPNSRSNAPRRRSDRRSVCRGRLVSNAVRRHYSRTMTFSAAQSVKIRRNVDFSFFGLSENLKLQTKYSDGSTLGKLLKTLLLKQTIVQRGYSSFFYCSQPNRYQNVDFVDRSGKIISVGALDWSF